MYVRVYTSTQMVRDVLLKSKPCPVCGKKTYSSLARIVEKTTVLFIPIISRTTRYIKMCEKCNSVIEMSKEDYMVQREDALKSKKSGKPSEFEKYESIHNSDEDYYKYQKLKKKKKNYKFVTIVLSLLILLCIILTPVLGEEVVADHAEFTRNSPQNTDCKIETDFILPLCVEYENKNEADIGIGGNKYYCFVVDKKTENYAIVSFDAKVYNQTETIKDIVNQSEKKAELCLMPSADFRADKSIVLYGKSEKLPEDINEFKDSSGLNIKNLDLGKTVLEADINPNTDYESEMLAVIGALSTLLCLVMLILFLIAKFKVKRHIKHLHSI